MNDQSMLLGMIPFIEMLGEASVTAGRQAAPTVAAMADGIGRYHAALLAAGLLAADVPVPSITASPRPDGAINLTFSWPPKP